MTIEAMARIVEVCIEETAIKLSNIAADRGVYKTETDILWAVEHDPQSATAKAFREMFQVALKSAAVTVQAMKFAAAQEVRHAVN